MRKLLLLFVCALASIGAWAGNIGYENGTAYLTGFAPGELAIALSGGTPDSGLTGDVSNLTSATKIYFGDDSGSLTLNDQDLAAIAKCTAATQLDMAKAKLASGADITKLKSSAEYIELPFGTYTKEQFEGLKAGNTNLKFAAALTSKGQPEDYAGYSYQAGNLKNFADQGLMSVNDLCSTGTTVTLYGELNSTDLGNLNNVLHVHQKVTDISDATVTDLTGVNGKMDNNQFLIIPQNISTSWNDEWPNYSLSSTEGYPHFGFYTDSDKKKLCVHTGEATKTVGSDLANLYDFVDETMTLSILPDMNSDGSWVKWLIEDNSPDKKANYLNTLKDLKLGCLDLSWFNLSGLGTDFSNFTKVSHLVLPNNNNNYDFASSQYSFPANVKTVADYTNDADHAGTQFTLDGQYYDLGSTKKATAVFVRQAGSLAEAHQLWPSRMFDIDDYYLAGQISNNDVAALSNQEEASSNTQIKATTVDMHHAFMSGSEMMSGYANRYVEYLALPDGQGTTINTTSATTCAYSSSSNLKCVAGYDPTDNKLYTFSTEAGKIRTLTSLIWPNPQGSSRYAGNNCTGLENVVMSGKMNHDDIMTTTGEYGLNSASIKNANLKWAVFPNQNDMCFGTAGSGWEPVEHIDLPITSQTILPSGIGAEGVVIGCFQNLQKLNNLLIPGTYEEIGQNAFSNCLGLKHVYTNLVSPNTGIEADNGNYTITLPPSLKIIRTGAFDNVDFITDVYITTPNTSEAPLCEKDAFDATTYWGDNSVFDGGTSWNRVRKTESDGSISAAIAYLHWPKTENIEDDRNKIYTDPTRHYQIKADDDVVDDYGDVIYFPSQNEFNRSYIQAVFGYTWAAWPEEYWDYTEDNKPGNPFVLKNPNVSAGSTQAEVDAVSNSAYTYDTKYTGWHQFVLSKNIAYTTIIEVPEEFSLDAYKENDWYTICVPFDLKKSEMLEFFGTKASTADQKNFLNGEEVTSDVYPKVVTLVGVERDIDNYTIKLEFSKDFIANSCVWDFSQASGAYGQWQTVAEMADKSQKYKSQNGDFVVIEKNRPYFFKPAFSDDLLAKIGTADDPRTCNKTAEDGAEPWRSYAVQAAYAYKKTGGNQYNQNGTTTLQGVTALDKDDNPRQIVAEGYNEGYGSGGWNYIYLTDNSDYATSNTNHALYHFVGTYSESQVPAYAYYLGKAKSGKHQFFRHTNGKNRKWSPFSCVIGFFKGWDGADQNNPAFPDANVADDSFIDKSTGEAKAFTFSMSFDEDPYIETTGISEMKASVMANDGKIYTVNGQYVGTSREGLAKGVYVINGKKFIVK